ncbi:MAG: PKD domain-containing protein [bacterium]
MEMPGSNYSYLWDFGDGEKARGRVVEHSYGSHGNYHLTLTATDQNGAILSDSEEISISFFHFTNWKFALLLGGLGAFLMILVIAMGRLRDEKED